jgi:hypothetical protein
VPDLKSALTSERFLTFAEVTALFFSWGVPTLFRASCETAAMLVPVSATNSATQATTRAGDGRRFERRIVPPFRG